MQNARHPAGFGLLGSAPPPGPRARSRRRAKRNPWPIVAWFALVIAVWINSQL